MNVNSYALIAAVSGIALIIMADQLPGFGAEIIAKMFGDALSVFK